MKTCYLALSIALTACFFAPRAIAQQADSAEYPDVPRGHWAYEAVNKLSQAGILEGHPNGHFDGNQPLTRYEFAIALARTQNIDPPGELPPRALLNLPPFPGFSLARREIARTAPRGVLWR